MTIPPASAPVSKPDQDADLVSRCASELVGELRCFDRVIMHGTLIDLAHPGALLVTMHQAGFKPKDLTRFAQPITQQVRDHIIGLAPIPLPRSGPWVPAVPPAADGSVNLKAEIHLHHGLHGWHGWK